MSDRCATESSVVEEWYSIEIFSEVPRKEDGSYEETFTISTGALV